MADRREWSGGGREWRVVFSLPVGFKCVEWGVFACSLCHTWRLDEHARKCERVSASSCEVVLAWPKRVIFACAWGE